MKRNVLAVLIITVVFGAAYAAFGFWTPHIWNSPDETAVAFFARVFAWNGRLWVFHPLESFSGGLIHPRSIAVIDSYQVPGSFYGSMWILGAVFKLIGFAAFALVTPILTVAAGIVIFFLIRKWRDARTGIIATLLFMMHPAVWYYASRGLYPNVLFMDFVILGIGVLVLRPWRNIAHGRGSVIFTNLIDDLLGVGAAGVAFLIRPVEFLWLAPLAIVAWWMWRKRIGTTRTIIGIVVFSLFILAVAITNNALYGSPFRTGYTAGTLQPGIAPPAVGTQSTLPAVITEPRPFVLPFGFHPRGAVTNLWDYLVWFVPWFAILGVAGIIICWRERKSRPLLAALAWVIFAIGIYYGSGVFQDAIHEGLTVGSSYARYFLPITLLIIPFAAHAVGRLADHASEKLPPIQAFTPAVLSGAFIFACLVFSYWTVLYRNPESLVPVRDTLMHYADVKKDVLALTGVDDIIITERSDKVFFPDRQVMLNLRDPQTMDAAAKLVHFAGLYYYGITISDGELPNLEAELGKRGLALTGVQSFANESLYALTPR